MCSRYVAIFSRLVVLLLCGSWRYDQVFASIPARLTKLLPPLVLPRTKYLVDNSLLEGLLQQHSSRLVIIRIVVRPTPERNAHSCTVRITDAPVAVAVSERRTEGVEVVVHPGHALFLSCRQTATQNQILSSNTMTSGQDVELGR